MKRLTLQLGSGLVLLVSPASRLAGQDSTTALRRVDSAGVTLISMGVAAVPRAKWKLGSAVVMNDESDPMFRIVGMTGGASRLVAVGDAGSSTLRVFDRQGREGRRRGRSGEGPGEFRVLTSIGSASGDSLWGFDMGLRRISFFGPEGMPAGETRLDASSFGAVGSILQIDPHQSVALVLPTTTAQTGSGLRRDSLTLLAYDRGGHVGAIFARLPGYEQRVQVTSSRQGIRVAKSSVPLGFGPLYAVDGGRAIVAGTESYDLRVHERGGKLSRLIRVFVTARPTRGPMLKAYATDVAQSIGKPELAEEIFDSAEKHPVHTFAPEIDAVITDRSGGFWVRRFPLPGAKDAEWVVHDAVGIPKCRIVLPANWRVKEIGKDYLLFVQLTEAEEEQAFYVPLTRSQGPAAR